MPDVTLSDALAEAYASAPASAAVIDTISIYYVGLVDEMSNPHELYLYNGASGDRRAANGVPLKDFRLEAGADPNAGELIEFISLAFKIVLPDVTSDATAKGQLVIDGVGGEVAAPLLAAIALGVPLRVTYRAYLEGLESVGPQQVPPIEFALANVSIVAAQVTGDIVVPNRGNRRFPSETYTVERFPSLGN